MGFDTHPDANLLAAYSEGGLAPAARQRLQLHVAHCAACRELASTALRAHGIVCLPPAPRWHRPGAWAGVAAACMAAAGVGIWLNPFPAPRPRPASVPAIAAVASQLAATPAPPQLRPMRRIHVPAPAVLAVNISPAPNLPEVALPPPGAEFQPAIDFSPLMTGFLDQPRIAPVRTEFIAALSPAAPAASNVGALPVANLAPAPAAWPFAAGFATSQPLSPPSGPMAPSISAGLGWAISRGGQVLHSIGAGVWAAVPLVPGIHFHALFSSDATIWAGGATSQLFYSSDRGAHWRQVQLPGVGSRPAPLRSISFTDAQHGTVAADDGTTWTTINAGQSWQKQ